MKTENITTKKLQAKVTKQMQAAVIEKLQIFDRNTMRVEAVERGKYMVISIYDEKEVFFTSAMLEELQKVVSIFSNHYENVFYDLDTKPQSHYTFGEITWTYTPCFEIHVGSEPMPGSK